MPNCEFEPTNMNLVPFFSFKKYQMFKIIIIVYLMQKNHFSSFLEFFLMSPLLSNFLHDKSQEYFEQSEKKSMKKAFLEEEIY